MRETGGELTTVEREWTKTNKHEAVRRSLF